MNIPTQTMSTVEKLDAMEQLWTSLNGVPTSERMPDWHAIVLEQRRQRVERGETTFSSLEDVKTRLRNLVK